MAIVATDDSDTYTLGRTPLDEGSASGRDLCNTQHPQDTYIHVPSWIRTRNPSKRAATGIG